LTLLLLAGQEYEAETPPPDGTRPLDRLWSAAAQEGLVSPTPPVVERPPAPTTGPARQSMAPRRRLTNREWRKIALIVAVICLLAAAGSAVVWERANQGQDLINQEIPSGGGGDGSGGQ
jgi:hypothetical protein